MTNLEQIRASRAFTKAALFTGRNDSQEYLSLARSLPAMFQNNGLLATWAFLLSKNKTSQNPQKDLLSALLEHFKDTRFNLGVGQEWDIEKVFTHKWTGGTHPLSGAELMKLTGEAVIFSGWLKRAAEALCNKEGGQS